MYTYRFQLFYQSWNDAPVNRSKVLIGLIFTWDCMGGLLYSLVKKKKNSLNDSKRRGNSPH